MMKRKLFVAIALISLTFPVAVAGDILPMEAVDFSQVCADFAEPGSKLAHRFYSLEAGNDSSAQGIEYDISAVRTDKVETVTLRLRNTRHTAFQPLKAGLKLGIDTYMDSYPEWYGKFFPTLAVCEPDHFYGYMQSPGGRMKAVVSADPIASWSLDYNMGYPDGNQQNRWFYGHRIECLNLDMLCRGPLPEHNPKLWKLEPGEERTWTVKLIDLDCPECFEETVHRHTGAPVIGMGRTSCAPGEALENRVGGKRKFSSYFRFPTSHTTVRAVRHTAVPYTLCN